jgi:hypothetical protein
VPNEGSLPRTLRLGGLATASPSLMRMLVWLQHGAMSGAGIKFAVIDIGAIRE